MADEYHYVYDDGNRISYKSVMKLSDLKHMYRSCVTCAWFNMAQPTVFDYITHALDRNNQTIRGTNMLSDVPPKCHGNELCYATDFAVTATMFPLIANKWSQRQIAMGALYYANMPTKPLVAKGNVKNIIDDVIAKANK
jgi:hypothetical protein